MSRQHCSGVSSYCIVVIPERSFMLSVVFITKPGVAPTEQKEAVNAECAHGPVDVFQNVDSPSRERCCPHGTAVSTLDGRPILPSLRATLNVM